MQRKLQCTAPPGLGIDLQSAGSPELGVVLAAAGDDALGNVRLQHLQHDGSVRAQDLAPRLDVLRQLLVAAGHRREWFSVSYVYTTG